MNLTLSRPIIQVADYYPFGLVMVENSYENILETKNHFKYNGKELQEDLDDLNWYDYGARMYDPSIGRWHVVDPLSEVSRSHSSYEYTYNNPLRFKDPDGMAVHDSKRNQQDHRDWIESREDRWQRRNIRINSYMNLYPKEEMQGNLSDDVENGSYLNNFGFDLDQGIVDLGNKNHMELINNLMKALYIAFNGGSRFVSDFVDFSNASNNFKRSTYSFWSGPILFKSSSGKKIIIELSAIVDQPKSKGKYLARKAPYNIYNQESPSKYSRKIDSKRITDYPFIYKFNDQNNDRLIEFWFHYTNDQEYSNFISYMSTGKEKYLFK